MAFSETVENFRDYIVPSEVSVTKWRLNLQLFNSNLIRLVNIRTTGNIRHPGLLKIEGPINRFLAWVTSMGRLTSNRPLLNLLVMRHYMTINLNLPLIKNTVTTISGRHGNKTDRPLPRT